MAECVAVIAVYLAVSLSVAWKVEWMVASLAASTVQKKDISTVESRVDLKDAATAESSVEQMVVKRVALMAQRSEYQLAARYYER